MKISKKTFRHSAFAGYIGVGREDITPPPGIYARSWGAAAQDVAEGVHRPLTATALTLQTRPEDAPLVLVALDLGWWQSADDELYVRSALLEALSLDSARVLINMAHTHAGPSLCREDADKPGGSLIAPYLETVRGAIVRAAQTALSSAQAAVLTWEVGTCGLARHRDLPDPDRPRIVCGFHPGHPADNTLLVGRVTDEQSRIVATLVNYACHPVTLAWENRLISPDFVGAMRETVEKLTESAPCLFLQGASGELGPREQYVADPAIADAHGRELGFAVLAVLEGMLPPRVRLEYAGVVESGAPLATWKRVSDEPFADLRATQLGVELRLQSMPTFAEIEQELENTTDRVLAERLRRKRRVRKALGDGHSARLPGWVWQVGDAFLVGHPNEAYSWMQTYLRERFPDHAVVVMNIVNGWFGYLSPPELYTEDIYQVWQSPFDRDSLHRVTDSMRDEIERLRTSQPG